MSETIAIAEMATKMSQEIFDVFGWTLSAGPIDIRWECVDKDKHGVDLHPTDVVYFYDDPYRDTRIYVNFDLKSYSADTLEKGFKGKIGSALKSLAKSTECANISASWQTKYTHSDVSATVVGALFAYNHDGDYDISFRRKLADLGDEFFTLAPGRRIYIFGPQDIQYLSNIANDILRRRGFKVGNPEKLPEQDECHFFYPDLIQVRARSQGGISASIEMLLGPFQILTYTIERREHYLFYYRGAGESTDDFMYLIDYLFRYQLLREKVTTIKILLPNGSADSAAIFRQAIEQYVEKLHGLPEIRQRLAGVTCQTVTKITERWCESELRLQIGAA